jgi:circadian clock protein KaiC
MASTSRLSTGIGGLDEILHGGFISERNYMLRGPAGSGKTILGFHFLEAGLENDETCLFINLEEDVDDLRANAAALGFETASVEFLDLSPTPEAFTEDDSYNVFEAAEVEQEPLAADIVDTVEAVDPDRVVVDPLTQFRYLTADDYQFRKQVVGFMRYLKGQGATVAFTVQDVRDLPTEDLEFIADGTINLESSPYGRSVTVPKFRGSPTRGGDHTYRITDDGLRVFPSLEPGGAAVDFPSESVSTGIPEVDELLHGGLERGTVSVVSGPSGVGKTTLCTQFVKEAASRGERSVIYLFEENRETFVARSTAVDIPVEEMIERGTLEVREVEALELSPQEFATVVREDVEANDRRIVMVDGIAGYRLTVHGESDMVLRRMHALGRYLKDQGVTTIFVDETKNITGEFTATQENISYLADNIVFLRHLELQGELRKAIGVLKKRTSDFERTLREFEITENGITVGEPLTRMRGILSGAPELVERADDR